MKEETKALAVGSSIIVGCVIFVSLCAGWIPFHHQVCSEGTPPACEEGAFPFYFLLMAKPYSEVLTAFGTLVLAGFTYTLWRATYTQAALTREAIKLASEEFNVSHRPKLRVRHLNFIVQNYEAPISPEDEQEIEFTIVNVGDREVRGVTFVYWIGWFRHFNDATDAYWENQITRREADINLQPGAFEHITFRVQAVTGAAALAKAAGSQIFILARVDYSDSGSTRRSTGIFRTCQGSGQDRPNTEFSRVDNSDYEYED